jgi:hypothetical protein
LLNARYTRRQGRSSGNARPLLPRLELVDGGGILTPPVVGAAARKGAAVIERRRGKEIGKKQGILETDDSRETMSYEIFWTAMWFRIFDVFYPFHLHCLSLWSKDEITLDHRWFMCTCMNCIATCKWPHNGTHNTFVVDLKLHAKH